MSTSMVSTVLEIEREAEAVLAKAARDADNRLAEAKTQRKAAAETHADDLKEKIAALDAAGAEERMRKVQELTTTGDAALSAVRTISDAAYDGGVQFVMKALWD